MTNANDSEQDIDQLTGLMNRRRFCEAVAKVLLAVSSDQNHPTLLTIDLDRFKSINDSAGLETGDAVLKRVASRIRTAAGQDAVLGRISGDEFAILLPHPLDAAATGAKLLELVARPYAVHGHAVKITASIGAATWPRDGLDAEALIQSANIALHHAEMGGRNRQKAFEPSMLELSRLKHALENDLRAALGLQQMELRAAVQQEHFVLSFHPQIAFAHGRLRSFDAVLNWAHPTRGSLGPDSFFRLAEEIGLVNLLGNWALRRACTAAAAWPPGPDGHLVQVGVDISHLQLREGRAFVQLVAETLAKTGLPPERLKLQLVEGALQEGADAVLQELRSLGVKLSLKDFGVGRSSLGMLAKIQFDEIKIDRSFTQAADLVKPTAYGMPPRSASGWMIRAISALGLGLGVTTLADGIATVRQFDIMRRDGLALAQGPFLGAPLSEDEVASAIRMPRAIEMFSQEPA